MTTLAALVPSAARADYTNYIGDANEYHVSAIATDANGNIYVTGSRTVLLLGTGNSATDVFVTKVDSSGNPTLRATLSGKAGDQANGIALDPAGNIYIVGSTSPDLPPHQPLRSVASQGAIGGTGFLVKMTADGTVLYSTYLGGATGYSTMTAVAADAQGNACVTVQTFASDYPHTSGLPNGSARGGAERFPRGSSPRSRLPETKIVYAGGLTATMRLCSDGSSCFLSTLATYGASIAVDPAGNAYIAGTTFGRGLPATSGAFLTDGAGAFAAKVNSAGTGMVYVTLLDGPTTNGTVVSAGCTAFAIAADSAGNPP